MHFKLCLSRLLKMRKVLQSGFAQLNEIFFKKTMTVMRRVNINSIYYTTLFVSSLSQGSLMRIAQIKMNFKIHWGLNLMIYRHSIKIMFHYGKWIWKVITGAEFCSGLCLAESLGVVLLCNTLTRIQITTQVLIYHQIKCLSTRIKTNYIVHSNHCKKYFIILFH